MHELRGYVRYRFRSLEDEVDITLEGDSRWVSAKVSELGLSNVGWTMPLAVESQSRSNSSLLFGDKNADKGPQIPPPDPSRIPVIRRSIGDLNIHAALAEKGLEQSRRPDADEIREILVQVEEPLPAQGPLVIDPMSEAWLKELMRIAVRQFGVTAMAFETIELAASDYLGDRQDEELEAWLESLFRMGKLVKVHGGETNGWGPAPRWLAS